MNGLMDWFRRHILHTDGLDASADRADRVSAELEDASREAKRTEAVVKSYMRPGRNPLHDLMTDFHNYSQRVDPN